MPVGKMVKIGVWEREQFIGCVVFGRGANNWIGREFCLKQTEACELVRVALKSHTTPVSKNCLLVDQDVEQGMPRFAYHRVICRSGARSQRCRYTKQGTGSTPGSPRGPQSSFCGGRWKHNREVTSGAFGKQRAVKNYRDLPARSTCGKHKYLMPLDAGIRLSVLPLSKPYPKRVASDTDDR